MKVVLLRGLHARSSMSKAVLKCLTTLGADIHVVSGTSVEPIRISRRIKTFTVSNLLAQPKGSDQFEKSLKKFADAKEVDVVVPAWTDSPAAVSQLSNQLVGTKTSPVSSPDLIDELDNKWTCHEFMSRIGFRVPATMLVSPNGKRRPENLDEIGFRAIVKTLHGTARKGVFRVETAQELYSKA